MAWVRTAVALIAAGVLALVISAWQYRVLVRYLWSAPFRPLAGIEAKAMIPIVAQTPLTAIVLAIIVIGVFAFGAVLLRVV
jgi:putative membrane protein